MVRDFLGLRECGEEKESGGAFDLFGALKAVMLYLGGPSTLKNSVRVSV